RVSFLEVWGGFAGKALETTLEVSDNGPRSARRNLANDPRQHLFFSGDDLVAASRGLRGGRRYRSSLHGFFLSHGFRIRRRAISPWLSGLEISRRRFFPESVVLAREHDTRSRLDGAYHNPFCRIES